MESNGESVNYLTAMLGKTLRIHIRDGRAFVGQFKCTDKERNVILGGAFEYREPSEAAIRAATRRAGGGARAEVGPTSRFMGLVVVPGEHVVKIELAKFNPEAIA